jgi:thiamine biosynthesis protein ThiS
VRQDGAAGQYNKKVTITLNGDPFTADAPFTVAELLVRLEIDHRTVAVERNFLVVKRDAYATTAIGDGDQVEIVNFVGGGCDQVIC